MKKIRELLKEKRWKWTAGGAVCLLIGAMLLIFSSEIGVRADEISLGNETVDLVPVDGEENTYWVENASQLRKLGNAAGGTAGLTFRMKNDITISSVTAPATGSFEGVFDGNGYAIIYEDIKIIVTDEMPSDASVENGLLFGNVSGTVQNLIIDVQDTDASYTRKSQNPVNSSVAAAVYENAQNPIIGENETVSGLDSDMEVLQKVNAIYELETVAGTDYKSHTLQEAGSVTTTYTPGNSSEDYFGLVCGKSTGTIRQVLLTGNAVSVQREELAAMDYAQSVQSGYRDETYYYKQEIDTVVGEAQSADLSIDANVYAGNAVYSEGLENNEISLSVSAPKAAAKGEEIVYEVTVENTGDEEYSGVTLSAFKEGAALEAEEGSWTETFPAAVAAGNSKSFTFTYPTGNVSSEEVALDFTVTGTAGTKTAAVKVSSVKTQLFDAALENGLSSVQGLYLQVSAPQKAEKGDQIPYTVSVKNNSSGNYTAVSMEASEKGTWSENDFALSAGETKKDLTFTFDTSNVTSGDLTLKFTAAGTNSTTAESAAAIVPEITTKVIEKKNYSNENSVPGLSLTISALEQQKMDDTGSVVYTAVVKNTSDQDYADVKIAALQGGNSVEGSWTVKTEQEEQTESGASYVIDAIGAGAEATVTYTYSYTSTERDAKAVSIDFETSVNADNTDVAVKVTANQIALIDTTTETTEDSVQELEKEEAADQLSFEVIAPTTKTTSWFDNRIEYTLVITNNSSETYDSVTLKSSTSGRWDGAWFTSSDTFEVGKIEPTVDEPTKISFVYNVQKDEEEISLDFTVSGSTAATTASITVSEVKTEIITDDERSVQEESNQGLELSVQAPKKVKKGDSIEYKITVTNKSDSVYQEIKLESNGTGNWSPDTLSDVAADDPKEVTFTLAASDTAADETSLDFTATAKNDVTSETVTAKVLNVVTQMVDAGNETTTEAVSGLEVNVSAPQVAEKGASKQIQYTITIANKGNTDYTGVTLNASKKGSWNGRGNKTSYNVGTVNANNAANPTSITFAYTYTAEDVQAGSVGVEFTLTGTRGDTSVTIPVSAVTTQMIQAEEQQTAFETDNGLKATLEIDNSNVITGSGESLQYTLTLENTNTLSGGFILSKDLSILPNLSAAGWSVNSSTAPEFSLGTANQVIPAGKKVVLTKTVTPQAVGEELTTNYQESIALTATMTSKAYKYSYDKTKSIAESDVFVQHTTAPVNSGNPVVSGNTLYAGGIAGAGGGTVSEVKQAITLLKSETDGKLFVGTVAGKADNSDNWSDLYLTGIVNNAPLPLGTGTLAAQNVAQSADKAAELAADSAHTAWASYMKYSASEGNTAVADTYGELAWLVKNAAFETGAMEQGTIPVTVAESEKVRADELDYVIAYKARKNMEQLTEEQIHAEEKITLEESAFYALVQAYATDGYYHYCTEDNTDAELVFPYDNNGNPYADSSSFEWEIVIRLIDGVSSEYVMVKLPNRENYVYNTSNDKLYYSVNVPAASPDGEAMLPIEPLDDQTYCSTAIEYTITEKYNYSYLEFFDQPEIRYGVTPYIDGHIYPMIISEDFGPSQRNALEAPQVTTFDYYNTDGSEREYVALKDQGNYEIGSKMKLNVSEVTAFYNPSFGYAFSQTVPAGDLWETVSSDGVTIRKYVGEEALSGFEFEIYDGNTFNAAADTAGEYYLYMQVESKSHTEVFYCYGPFQLVDKQTINGSVYPLEDTNAASVAADSVVEGDYLYLETEGTGALGSSSLQYLISDSELTNFGGQSWEYYTEDSFVPLTRKSQASDQVYVYVRNYKPDGSQTKYGEITGWSYRMQEDSAEVKAAPATISYRDGGNFNINAAATIEYNGKIALSTTDGSQIYYVRTEEEGEPLQIERVGTIPEPLQEGYFVIGGRCYHIFAGDHQAAAYSSEEQIAVNNDTRDTKELHLAVAAIKEGCNPGVTLNYVYKVGEQQQVAAPESALVTNRIENGKETEGDRAEISRGANLYFTSMTPNAELYYWIGNTVEGEGTKYDNGIKVVTTATAYVVTLVAKDPTGNMLDSEPVTFVYNITEPQQTDAPVATPVTSEMSPTVVIPGDKILLSSPTTGAVIYYALGGEEPKLEEDPETGEYTLVSGLVYEPDKGISMPEEQSGFFIISAVAVKSGLAPSQVVHFSYAHPSAVLAPYASVTSGNVSMDETVLLKNRTQDATIYYTVAYDGKEPEDPTLSSSVFDAANPFVINRKTVIKAMAVKDRVYSEIVTFTYNPFDQLEPPSASIDSGSVVSGGTILTLKAMDGATIYYTTDGSDPAEVGNESVMTGTSIILNGESGSQITIKAYASAEGKSDSEVATFTYLFSQNPGGVTADVESGSLVSNGSKVNLMTDVTGAEIYYTTDGDSPVDKGIKGTSVTVEGVPGTTFTIKAVAVLNGTPGIVSSFTYKIKDIPNTPSAAPGGGVLTVAVRVSLTSNVEQIYYTTDGSEPTKSSTPYTEPILINRTTILKAIAVSEDGEVSKVGTYTYFAADKAAEVTSTQADGTVLAPGDAIVLSTETEGAVIYYSTDGTEPTLDNLDSLLVYNGEEIEINRSVTIQAVAYRDDLRLSDVAAWNYIVDVIPAVEQKKAEEAKKAEEGLRDTDASELTRSAEGEDEEILTRKYYGRDLVTLIAYPTGALPEQFAFETEKEKNSPLAIEKAKEIYGDENTVLESYRFKVKDGTTPVQPKEEVEIALPLPENYEDAVLTIAYVEEGHNLESLETRRESGMLYAKTMKLGSYVIVGPEREDEEGTGFPYLLLLEIAAGAALFIGILYWIAVKVKKYLNNRKNYPNE